MKQSIQCQCENLVEIDAPDSVDLDRDPGLIEQIRNGTFLSKSCERCGTALHPDIELALHWNKLGNPLKIVQEQDRLAAIRGKIKTPKNTELLVGIAELVERVQIIEAGLDPVVCEVLKYYLQGKAEEHEPEAELAVYFGKKTNTGLQFRISGFASGETGLVTVPESKYLETAGAIGSYQKKMPFKAILKGNYRSYRKAAFLEED